MTGPTIIETTISKVDVMPRSDRGRRRFGVSAETRFGPVRGVITEGPDAWLSRFDDHERIPAHARREVVRAFVAWLESRRTSPAE